MSGPLNRTSLELYRDCMRLVRHLAPGHSPKGTALRQMVRSQFQANRYEKDPTIIEAKKADAVRALSNYMLYQSAQKDTQLQNAMKDQVKNIKKENEDEDKR
ncbi:unnamed protein product [Cylindrotheca closterium]|uniref:Complex 1 LYR protein domain-containing protein n=1 Tax=Cylindrotheca closterium TaxID=2856 RepID=A0AAD2G383_9STRA|nr:unnamed protein product [Cylindrotheca closterium]